MFYCGGYNVQSLTGTGKTLLIKTIHEKLLKAKRTSVLTATTGMAAALHGGCTLHRFLGIANSNLCAATLADLALQDQFSSERIR